MRRPNPEEHGKRNRIPPCKPAQYAAQNVSIVLTGSWLDACFPLCYIACVLSGSIAPPFLTNTLQTMKKMTILSALVAMLTVTAQADILTAVKDAAVQEAQNQAEAAVQQKVADVTSGLTAGQESASNSVQNTINGVQEKAAAIQAEADAIKTRCETMYDEAVKTKKDTENTIAAQKEAADKTVSDVKAQAQKAADDAKAAQKNVKKNATKTAEKKAQKATNKAVKSGLKRIGL